MQDTEKKTTEKTNTTTAHKTNDAYITGTVMAVPEESHSVKSEKFYRMRIQSERNSGVLDEVEVIFSERLYDPSKITEGMHMHIRGQLRTYNKGSRVENLPEGGVKFKSRLIVFIFAQEMFSDTKDIGSPDTNEIYLNGVICKPPVHRVTPKGHEITDVIIAVNRNYHKTDHIPVLCWERTSDFVAGLPVGTCLTIKGRLQSRIYKKVLSDGTEVMRTAYELSASSVDKCMDNEVYFHKEITDRKKLWKAIDCLTTLKNKEEENVSEGTGSKEKLAAFNEALTAARGCL